MSFKNKQKSNFYLSAEGYDLYASNYDQKLDFLDTFEKGLLSKVLGEIEGKKVLDLGCGTGRVTRELLKKGAEVTGLDISEGMIKIAKEKFPKADFVVGDCEKMPFKDGQFDVVVAAFLIVHLRDLKKCFEEVYRILKDGGAFVLTNINQKKEPKLKTKSGEEIKIASFYHIPKHVIEALEENLFTIETEEFLNENGVWINQIIRARK